MTTYKCSIIALIEGKLLKGLGFCALLLLIGCSTIPLPTGKSDTQFLKPTGNDYIATNIISIHFDEEYKSFTLATQQFQLLQAYKIPYIYDGNMRLDHTRKTATNDFRWEEYPVTALGVREIGQIIIKNASNETYTATPRLVGNEVILDLDPIIGSLKPGDLTVTCPKCTPNLARLAQQPTSLPAPPPLRVEATFSLQRAQVTAIQSRMRNERTLAARQAQEQARLQRERARRLAEEARERESLLREAEAKRTREQERIKREGDGSQDDLLCKKYGFKPNTDAYRACRLQIDVAKKEMQQQRLIYLDQQRKFQEAQDAERRRRQSDFMLGMGLRMMAGQSATSAAIDQSIGAPLYQPTPPGSRIYTLPNGRMMTCTTTGSVTNCF